MRWKFLFGSDFTSQLNWFCIYFQWFRLVTGRFVFDLAIGNRDVAHLHQARFERIRNSRRQRGATAPLPPPVPAVHVPTLSSLATPRSNYRHVALPTTVDGDITLKTDMRKSTLTSKHYDIHELPQLESLLRLWATNMPSRNWGVLLALAALHLSIGNIASSLF